MKEFGILFSGAMVRAILVGTKTQTRRQVKGEPLRWLNESIRFDPEFVASPENGLCPYGHPGERLWVREAWRAELSWDCLKPSEIPAEATVFYEADGHCKSNGLGTKLAGRYRHARFMPRWASRILLEIVSVRVERLQDISEADAIAEGCYTDPACPAYDAYRSLWEQINGPDSWDANPFVWVIEFKKIQ